FNMEFGKPIRQQIVPTRHHRKARVAAELYARLGQPDRQHRHDSDRNDSGSSPERAETDAEYLGYWRDQIYVVLRYQGEHRAGSENEHHGDDRSSDHDR